MRAPKLKKGFVALLLVCATLFTTMAPAVPVFATGIALSTDVTNPFAKGLQFPLNGEMVTSDSFRIPAIVTLSDGTLVAAADIRWNTTYDGGGLDTLVARSTDGGITWEYTVANYLGDNGNAYNGASTAFIDSSLTVAPDGKTVYLLCDLYPYGVALNGSKLTTPEKEVGFTDEGYLKLSADENATYGYYLKDGKIYATDGIAVTGYTVNDHFYLCDENGTVQKDASGNEIHLFFENSPYKVARIGFNYLISSKDGGKTWSAPTLLQVKTADENACLVAPGRGITTADGTMVFPVYSYNEDSSYIITRDGETYATDIKGQNTGFIYSKDGVTFERAQTDETRIPWSSEAAVVELRDGTLRFFYRNVNKVLSYVDYDMTSKEWSDPVTTTVATNSNTQLSAITYSKTSDGKQVILVSCPTGPSAVGSNNNNGAYRLNGKIFAFKVEDDDKASMTLVNTTAVTENIATSALGGSDYTEENGFFAYSCFTERADGSVILLHESNQFGWGSGDGKYYTIAAKAYEAENFGIVKTLNDDEHNITVSGDVPSESLLEVTQIEDTAAVKNAILGLDSASEETYKLYAYDIKLKKGDNYVQPGGAVTVTLADIVDTTQAQPFVGVVHLLDTVDAIRTAVENGTARTSNDPAVLDAHPIEVAAAKEAGLGEVVAYTSLSTGDGGVTIHEDGSISFESDSFSEYYIALRFTEGLTLTDRNDDTYYVEPGTTLTFNRSSVTWEATSAEVPGVHALESTITVSSDAVIGSEVTYTASWSSQFLGTTIKGTQTVKIVVSTRRQAVEGWIESNRYPVVLSLLQPGQNGTALPSEPGNTDDDFISFNADYGLGVWNAEFSPTAEGYIDPAIAEVLISSIDGSNVLGVADATGANCLKYLTGFDWERVLDYAENNNNIRAIDGTEITAANRNNYKVIPYVVKLMRDGRNIGWHIDCAIVKKTAVTLSYDINLDNYTVTENIYLPETSTSEPPHTTNVGSITYKRESLDVGEKVEAQYDGQTYNLTFKGWNTEPDGSGTSYNPNASITIDEDTVLYAIWEGALVPGDLYIYKDVTASDGATEPAGTTYAFTVEFGTAGTYAYTIYRADGTTEISSIETKNTLFLAAGEYAVFTGVAANTRYTVSEMEGDYETTVTGGSGTIPSGGRATARFTNHYPYVEPDVIIRYEALAGGTVTPPSETLKQFTGTASGSTAKSDDGYNFVGWYSDSACTVLFSKEETFKPTMPEGGWIDGMTYYAKFEPAETSLTIKKGGADAIDVNQSFLFKVEGEGLTGFLVTAHGATPTVVNGLKVGGSYTVTEITHWSWRYAYGSVSDTAGSVNIVTGTVDHGATVTLNVNAGENELTFVNTREVSQWFDGDSWADNRFTAESASEA